MKATEIKLQPLIWFSPQSEDNLRAHCTAGRKGGHTVLGLRKMSSGVWNLKGEYSGQWMDFPTKEKAVAWMEWLRNQRDYHPWVDWTLMERRRVSEEVSGIGWWESKGLNALR